MSTHDTTFQLRIPAEVKARLDAYARQRYTTASEIVRQAIINLLPEDTTMTTKTYAESMGATPEAIELLRELTIESGGDAMTPETWPTRDNSLWDDLNNLVPEPPYAGPYNSGIDVANAAAAGNAGALASLRVDFRLPVFS